MPGLLNTRAGRPVKHLWARRGAQPCFTFPEQNVLCRPRKHGVGSCAQFKAPVALNRSGRHEEAIGMQQVGITVDCLGKSRWFRLSLLTEVALNLEGILVRGCQVGRVGDCETCGNSGDHFIDCVVKFSWATMISPLFREYNSQIELAH